MKSKPNAISDTAGNYGLDGEQRNRGVEMNVFGEPMLGLRLNASTVWLDAKQTKTAEGATDGKDAIGWLTSTRYSAPNMTSSRWKA